MRSGAGKFLLAGGVILLIICAGCCAMLALFSATAAGAACGATESVGATEYGGPGDPASGHIGASGANLDALTDNAELGGTSFQTATALGGLPYGTPLLIDWDGHAVIAYKRDIGLGGSPIEGHPRVIDLWWKLAAQLGIPYEHGQWSGVVRIAQVGGDCAGAAPAVPGVRAAILAGDLAGAPTGAPAAVAGILAAGNQIVRKPYVYGGGHGLPLNEIAASYDCSSSVSHLLWGGGLLPAGGDMTSGQYMHWGLPGPGRWVTIYASPTHVFMYVAGIRWDTHNAAGAEDGPLGIGWHPLVRGDEGFVVRHPPGL